MSFSKTERELLGRLADILIPAGEESLSASAANVAHEWLNQLLLARPDLAAPLKALLEQSASHPADEFVTRLRATNPASFGILAEVVTGAYFLNPHVQQSIGYSGQTQRPIDPAPDYLEEGLLESVIRRGQIYRPTPGMNA